MHPVIGRIITSPNLPDRYLLSGSFKPKEENLLKKGVVFWIIEITVPGQEKIASLIIKKFKQYYQQKEDGLWGLEAVLKKINQSLAKQVQNKKTAWVNHLNAILGLVQDKTLHLAPTGETSAYLFRKNKISNILEVEESPPPLQTFISVVSGELQKNDRVFLGSSEFTSHITIETLADFLNQNLDKSLTEIANYFRERNVKNINALIIDYSDRELRVDTIYLDQAPQSRAFIFLKQLNHSKEKICAFLNQIVIKIGSWELNRIKHFIQIRDQEKQKEKKFPELTPALKIEGLAKANFLSLLIQSKKLKKVFSRYRKIIIIILTILILCLFAFLISAQKTSSKNKELVQKLEQAKTLIEEAKTKQATNQIQEAYNKLKQAQELAMEAKAYTALSNEAEDVLKIALNQINALTKVIQISTLTPVLADLNTQGEVESDKLVLLERDIITFNKKHYQFFKISPAGQKIETWLNLPQAIGNPKNAIQFKSDTSYLCIETNQKEFYLYSLKDKNLVEVKKAGLFDWPESPSQLLSYLDRVYLLNNEGLWRSSYTASGFSRPQKAVNYSDFNQIKSVAIDGAIYFLKDIEVVKFLGGEKTDFSLQIPFFLEIKEPTIIFTDETLEYIFIYLKNQQKIAIFDKNGGFEKQLALPENWGELQDLKVTQDGSIYILAQNKIYKISY